MARRASCRCGQCPGCKNRAKVARWQRENRAKYAAKTRRYRESAKGRKHDRARAAVRSAVEAGTLVRPNACERCGAPPPLDAHHTDYDKPLDVTWLCERCHNDEHNQEVHDERSDPPTDARRAA